MVVSETVLAIEAWQEAQFGGYKSDPYSESRARAQAETYIPTYSMIGIDTSARWVPDDGWMGGWEIPHSEQGESGRIADPGFHWEHAE